MKLDLKILLSFADQVSLHPSETRPILETNFVCGFVVVRTSF